ncbi:GNAT family N-acetyltransferase [Halobellus limi]|uniref:Acetyltransferase (GNAT) family protein n=1 Tax=Halobellus limi TaxID=699433 RepID=A0A1H5WLL9_9EURY|nr:GNAT family N-acetyltransferase [Halobellus limi]QCC46398.1 GNAT family N-acetyltransferase [Halobellus limi]SEG00529.1 Acetyltransferase (GNAT) family protein [Halobellus limi]
MNESDRRCTYWDPSECTGTPFCPPRCPRFVDGEETPLLVRRYEESEFDAVVRMYEDLDPENRTMGLPPANRDRLEEWLTKLTENGWNLVAVDDDRVVGHVGVVPAATEDPQFVIFVHDDYQNRGVGSELIKHLIASAADRGHKTLQLDVEKENRRAISVYRNVDFEVTERKGMGLSMELSLDAAIAEAVQRPPAER